MATFSDKLAEAGIQPIVGCTLQVDFGDRPQPNGLQRNGANYFYEADALGSITSLTDATGATADAPGYFNSWGDSYISSLQPFGFTGRERLQ